MQHNKRLTEYARELRRNMTKEEKQLWYHFLREYPVRFRRQVTCGNYILDFYCAKAKLAIELDGSRHFTANGNERDFVRDKLLTEQEGIVLLRFENKAVWNNTPELIQTIIDTITDRRNKIDYCNSND